MVECAKYYCYSWIFHVSVRSAKEAIVLYQSILLICFCISCVEYIYVP